MQPDDEIGYILADIFGQQAHAFTKFQRMMYWMPKLRGSNPWSFPSEGLPDDPAEVAGFVLKRMSPDPLSEVTVVRHRDPGFSEIVSSDDDFIAWSQSPKQKSLLKKHDVKQPLFVEGPHFVHARHEQLNYFVLRSDSFVDPKEKNYYGKVVLPNTDCKFNFMDYFYGKGSDLRGNLPIDPPSIHEQEDGNIFALAITGSGSKNSAALWIRLLQTIGENPRVADLSLVFRIFSTPPPGADADDFEIKKWLQAPYAQIATVPGIQQIESNSSKTP